MAEVTALAIHRTEQITPAQHPTSPPQFFYVFEACRHKPQLYKVHYVNKVYFMLSSTWLGGCRDTNINELRL